MGSTKKILMIYYSQSGQLDDIADNFLLPFDASIVDRVKIFPVKPFPFPWTGKAFFDAMPESVLEEKAELLPVKYSSDSYDLIIVGYQPWYLSPSIPATTLFKDEKFLSLIKDKPVVTVIGSRNMWINSQESIKEHIRKAGGTLIANIPLIDRNNNFISALTILYWMLSGKKEKYKNILPVPGISEKDIKNSYLYGEIIYKAFCENNYDRLQKKILDLNLISIGTDILFIEMRAKKIFRKFAVLIKKKGATQRKRALGIKLFKYYLVIALFFVAPIVLLFYTIFFRPFQGKYLKRKKQYFCENLN